MKPFISNENSVEDVLLRLLDYVQKCNQHGATINATSVDLNIKILFLGERNPKLKAELVELLKKSHSQLINSIFDDIDGLHIERHSLIDSLLELFNEARIVAITGEGGFGKSALAKECIRLFYNGRSGFIFFKGDQLDEVSLANVLANLGISSDFGTLMAQWITSPKLLIYIDGFEKLYESDHKEAVLELLNKIREFNSVTLIITCRSYALETLRIKFKIAKSEIAILPIEPFSKQELEEVKSAKTNPC